jgi:CHAT domain-containing protein/tetratricopeptide (TPR) repeat protein
VRRSIALLALTLAALTLAACREPPESLDKDLSQARQWLRHERFGRVLDRADGWLRLAEERRDLKAQWRFRLVKAEALLGQETWSEVALGLLNDPVQAPGDASWADDRAEWFFLKARASYVDGTPDVDEFLDDALQAAERAGRADLMAEVHLRKGFRIRDAGRTDEAHRVFADVLSEAKRHGDLNLQARAQDYEGALLVDESRYDEAIPALESSRALAIAADAPATAARAEGNLGVAWLRLGDYDNAKARFEIAETEFERIGNPFEVQIWTGSAGNVSHERGDLREAKRAYTRAVEISRGLQVPKWTGRWLSNLATVSIEQADWDGAEKFNNEARDLKARTKDAAYVASSLNNAGRIALGRGDPDTARGLFTDALRQNSEDPKAVLEAHTGLAEVYARKGLTREAEAEFRSTLARIEDRQSKLFKTEYRLSWLASLIGFYQNYVDFLVSQKQTDRALEAAESSRSKVLTSQRIPPLGVTEYRRLARRTGSVLLEYWIGRERSYLWVVSPEKVAFHVLPARSELTPLIRSYRAVVTGGRNPLGAAYDTGIALYNALLAPALQDSGSATRFIVVPDDELYSLNFETLPDGINYNRYWIDQATIRIAPSLNYLATNVGHRGTGAPPGLLVIGDPDSSLPQYPHLEFAGREVAAIAEVMSASHPVVVEREAATPDSYAGHNPAQFGLIHFAAHAAAPARLESALESAVILSGPPDRCRLLARTVMSIPLHARLVTVSACRSAGGRTYGGEGLVGFAWAFMKAGADNVIAGLWDVNDHSTVLLMKSLYGEIARGVPPAEALRTAKLAMIHGGGSYARPYYWAPFQTYTARAD